MAAMAAGIHVRSTFYSKALSIPAFNEARTSAVGGHSFFKGKPVALFILMTIKRTTLVKACVWLPTN